MQNEPRIAIITTRYYEDFMTRYLDAVQAALVECQVAREAQAVFTVPGAVEIPLMAQHCARKQCFDAIITLGLVIRGETDHYQYVCEQASQGCQQVMLNAHIPVIFGVFTVHHIAQAEARLDGTKCFIAQELAQAAMEMCHLLAQ